MVKANWQAVREFLRILIVVVILGTIVSAVLLAPWEGKPPASDRNCLFPSENGIVVGYDRHQIFLLRKPEPQQLFYDLAEYTRLGETQDRALWKFSACWRLPASAVHSLVTYEHWPPL